MKIILLGNAGAGKSTMAKKLMANQNIPRLSLDEVAWAEPAIRMSEAESVELVRSFIQQHDQWILEGCYSDIIEPILPECDELRFLNPGIETCIKHCHARPWEPEIFESPEKHNANIQNLINWVNEYESREDEYGLKRHRKLFDSYNGNKREYSCVSEYEA
jgi:adenylate kinase family enzyme